MKAAIQPREVLALDGSFSDPDLSEDAFRTDASMSLDVLVMLLDRAAVRQGKQVKGRASGPA